jgi:hypothetical protein
MELNHQIRLCRPFPFRFGFRALSHNVGIVATAKQALQEIRAAIVLVPLHEIPPPKESMKKPVENRSCDGAYVTNQDLHPASE